jgi:hypothetical protein
MDRVHTKQTDLPRLLAALNERSTGLSATHNERLIDAFVRLAHGERSTDVLRSEMGLTGPKLNPALRTGKRLYIIRERNGGRGRSNILSADMDALAAFARSTRMPALPPLRAPGDKRRELLERFDWAAAGIKTVDTWRRCAQMLMAIGDVRKVSHEKLATELATREWTWSSVTVKKYVGILRRAALLETKPPRNRRESNAGTIFTIRWESISAGANRRIRSTLDAPTARTPITKRQFKSPRLDASQRDLIERLDRQTST